SADVTILPSKGPGETWGLILNESLAAGTPVIASSHVGATADLVRTDVTGWSFPAGDEAALTARLKTAITAVRTHRADLKRSAQGHITGYSYETATGALQTLLAPLPFNQGNPR